DSPPRVSRWYSGASIGRLSRPIRQIFIARSMLGAPGDAPGVRPAAPTSPFGPWPRVGRRKLDLLGWRLVNPRKAIDYLGDTARKYGVGAVLHDLEIRLLNKLMSFQKLRGGIV